MEPIAIWLTWPIPDTYTSLSQRIGGYVTRNRWSDE